jgi:hypothetical protein
MPGYNGDLIVSQVTGELLIGDSIELLSASAIIESFVSEPSPYTIIYLSSNINDTQTITWGELTYGEGIVDISSTCDIKTHTSIPDMIVGIDPEVLYVDDHFIYSNVYGSLTQNYMEIFSGNVRICSEVYLFMDDGISYPLPYQFIHIYSNVEVDSGFCINLQDLSANCNILSNSNNTDLICEYDLKSLCEIQTNILSNLYVGTISNLSSTCHIESKVDNSIIVLGGELVELSSSIYIDTSSDGILYLGITNILSCDDCSKTIIKSNVENIYPLSTNLIFLFSTNICQININNPEIIFGENEFLSSSCIIQSNLSSNIILGRDEILSSSNDVYTNIHNTDLTLGINENLSSLCNFSLDITGIELFVETFSELNGNISINSNAYSDTIVIGEITNLSSNCFIESNIYSDLNLGIINDLYGNIVIKSETYGLLDLGVIELLSTSHITTSHISSLMVYGIDENLNSVSHSTTNVISNLSIGNEENLSANNLLIQSNLQDTNLIIIEYQWFTSTIDIKSNVDGFMDLGVHENISSNENIISEILADLTIGHVEELNGNCNISIQDIADIKLGIDTELSANGNIISEILANLEIGGEVSLNSNHFIVSEVNGDISFGVNTPLSAHLTISTQTDNFILYGNNEYIAALISINTNAIATLFLGNEENISSNCNIHTNSTCGALGLAYNLSNANCEIISNSQAYIGNLIGIISNNNLITSNVLNLYDYTFEIIHNDVERKFTYDLPVTFSKVVIRSNLNKSMIPFGSEYISDEIPFDNSFIDVLFRDDYNFDFYRYLYRRDIERETWPSIVLTRLMLDPLNSQYFRCDGNDPNLHIYNLYALQSDDLLMIDKLLLYRNNQVTNYENINYNDLTTNLSKMIYIYLDVKIHDNNSKYLPGISMSGQGDVLEACFEVYLVENIFNQILRTGTWS